MSTTIAHIVNWVCRTAGRRDDIRRDATEDALSVYLRYCAAVPFPALYQVSSAIPTVADQGTYDLSSLNMFGIRHITMDFGDYTRKIERSHQRVYARRGVIVSGKTATYARINENEIQFNPPPDSASYTFTVFYWARPDVPDDDANTSVIGQVELVTPREWDELFKWETLANMYLGPLQRPDLYSMLNFTSQMPYFRGADRTKRITELGIIPKLTNDLLKTIEGREFIDEEFGIPPRSRQMSYTWGGRR